LALIEQCRKPLAVTSEQGANQKLQRQHSYFGCEREDKKDEGQQRARARAPPVEHFRRPHYSATLTKSLRCWKRRSNINPNLFVISLIPSESAGEQNAVRDNFAASKTLETQKSSLSPLIYVSDDLPERERTVFDILRCMPLQAAPLKLQMAQRLQSAIAIVGLCNALEAEDSKLRLIGELKRVGHNVVAYAHGADQWEIRAKCRPILAGASILLDSSTLEFRTEFVSAVTEAIDAVGTADATRGRLLLTMAEHGIIGNSLAIIETFRAATRYSQISDLPVLITGESGTGKELIARSIARMDPHHKAGSFVAVNCAAVPSTMLESEVFGHKRGAFTGADQERKGWIKTADNGVLFLDEIGEMEPGLQAKLLRVLQDARVRALGDDNEVAVRTRFIAATNRNLQQSVEQGRFRNDLLNRLHVLTVHMPSLAERLDDIRPLIEHFVQKHRAIPPKTVRTISDDYIAALAHVKMPGNIRELENIVRRSLVCPHRAGKLCLHDLPADILSQLAHPVAAYNREEEQRFQVHEFVKTVVRVHGWNLQVTLRECEKIVCSEVLKLARGNQSEAARLLGVTSRCVYNKLHKFAP
jgi:two-component system response regulator AtoC